MPRIDLMATQDPMAIQHIVDRWNLNHPIGTAVTLTNGLGVVTHTVTSSPAMLFAKNEAVVYVRGRVGFFNLNRLTVEHRIKHD